MTTQSITATVTVILEVQVGTWGTGSTFDQIRDQGREGAIGRIRRLIGKDEDVSIVGTPKVTAILAGEEL